MLLSRTRENPYLQYFCGEISFQYEEPYDPGYFVHFRKRIMEYGAEKILKLSINLFDSKEVHEKEILINIYDGHAIDPQIERSCGRAVKPLTSGGGLK